MDWTRRPLLFLDHVDEELQIDCNITSVNH